MTKPAFELERVTRRHRRSIALDQFSLSQEVGSILGLVGLPDSGKTTLLHLIAGLDKPTAGLISVLEGSPLQSSIRARIGVALTPQLPDPTLTYQETLIEFSRLKGFSLKVSRKMAVQLLDDLKLASETSSLVGELSASSRQLLCAGTALVGEPEILLFDDALDDLNEADQSILTAILRNRASQGSTVVIASRCAGIMGDLCDDIALLHQGTLLGKGTPKEIRASLRGLLFKYRVGNSQPILLDWEGVTARFTGTDTEVLAGNDIAEQLALHCDGSSITEIDPTLEEACAWILRNPDAIAARSKLWGRSNSNQISTDCQSP